MSDKKISLLIVGFVLLCFCACGGQKKVTYQPQPESTTEQTTHTHIYSDANCVLPKICTDCGETEGDELGHDYVNNKCSRCGEIDPDSLPIKLNDLFLIDSYNYEYKQGAFTDSFGNIYDEVYYYTYLYRTNEGGSPRSLFNLEKKYKTFSGSIVASTITNSNYTYCVNIYVDDVLKFSKTEFSKISDKVDFEIDVSEGKILKIEVFKEGPMGSANQEIGIVNAELTR